VMELTEGDFGSLRSRSEGTGYAESSGADWMIVDGCSKLSSGLCVIGGREAGAGGRIERRTFL
jgi:hypothetical protein